MDYDLSINSLDDLENMIEEAKGNWEGQKKLVDGADLDNPVVNIYRLWKSKRMQWGDRATIALLIANTTDALSHILELKKTNVPHNLFNIGVNAVEIEGRLKQGGIELISDNFKVAGRVIVPEPQQEQPEENPEAPAE